MNEMTAKPAQLVAQYIQLRDARDRINDELKGKMKNFTLAMETIETTLLKLFNDMGVDNIKARGIGTAYRLEQTSVTTADQREFRRHVIGNEEWDLADWKPNKTRVKELLEQGQPLPPGVNYRVAYTIGIRRDS